MRSQSGHTTLRRRWGTACLQGRHRTPLGAHNSPGQLLLTPHGTKPCFLFCIRHPRARTRSCTRNSHCHPSSPENEHLSATLDFLLPQAAGLQIFRLGALLESPQGPILGTQAPHHGEQWPMAVLMPAGTPQTRTIGGTQLPLVSQALLPLALRLLLILISCIIYFLLP